jgi:hypothetical protein
MYSFLLGTRDTVDPSEYDWFTYTRATKIINANLKIEKGARFGVRPATESNRVNLVLHGNLSRVFSVSMENARTLAKGVRKS